MANAFSAGGNTEPTSRKVSHEQRPNASQNSAQLYDIEEEKARRIVAIEAAQIEAGLVEVLFLRRAGALSDEELIAIWGQGL